jgi:hypothetical protein
MVRKETMVMIVWWSGLVGEREVAGCVVEVLDDEDDDELLGGRDREYLYSS